MMRLFYPVLPSLVVLALVLSPCARGFIEPQLKRPVSCLSLREEKLGEAVRLIASVSGLPLVSTPEASDVIVSCYFKNMPVEVCLHALCRAHNLALNISPEGVLIISTMDQHLASQTTYSTDYVETVTVKFPSVYDVGDTLKGLFRDRIVWQRPDQAESDPYERLQMAIDRMDLLAERSQFGIGSTGSGPSGVAASGTGSAAGSRSSTSQRNGQPGSGQDLEQMQTIARREAFINEQARLRMARGDEGKVSFALVYLSALPEINTLLIRSSDRNAVQAVQKAIAAMDKPRGQVLLNVTVLSVTLGDGVESGVEWLINQGKHSTGFADGSIEPLRGYTSGTGVARDPGSVGSGIVESINPAFTGGIPTYAFFDNDIRIRAQLLAQNENIRQLANPTLLVADNEAATIFVGQNAKFLDSIEPGRVTQNQNTTTITEATPVIEERNIGLSLLITPRVHADRTVTLRVMQERSGVDPVLREIEFGGSSPVAVQDISQEMVTSTLVAKDGSLVILGGLVQERTLESESGVPFLKDIPLLGRAFKSDSRQLSREELIVLIQPRVLAIPGEEAEASAQRLGELEVDLSSPVERFENDSSDGAAADQALRLRPSLSGPRR